MKTIVQLTEEQKEYFLGKDTAAKQAVESNIAPVEADASSASRAYVVGEQLFLNDVLYDVTSPISVGDAIVVNTNITIANKLSADIKSKIDDLYSKNQAFTKQITVNGAVNELDHTGVTDTSGTVKFTVNEDKSITVSADSYPVTLDSTITFFFFGTASAAVPNIFKGKKLVGCPSGGASGTYRIIIQEFSSTTPSGAIAESSDIGEGANISNGNYIRMYIRLGSGYQLTSALTFKPMISLPELGLSYDDYVPYAKTNRQLTEDSVTWNDLSEVGAVNYFNNTASSPQTDKGVTYTVDATTKKITATGTNDGTANSYIVVKQNLKAGTYRCSGCPSGGSNGNYRIVWDVNDRQNNFDYGDGVIITLATDGYVTAYFNIMKNYAISGSVVFEPMITSLDYNGPYVPYAKTNKELTDELSVQLIENALTAIKDLTFSMNKAIKTGNVVELDFQFTVNEELTGYTSIASIPLGLRPKSIVTFVAFSTSGGQKAFTYRSDGYIQNINDLVSGEILRGTAIFITG